MFAVRFERSSILNWKQPYTRVLHAVRRTRILYNTYVLFSHVQYVTRSTRLSTGRSRRDDDVAANFLRRRDWREDARDGNSVLAWAAAESVETRGLSHKQATKMYRKTHLSLKNFNSIKTKDIFLFFHTVTVFKCMRFSRRRSNLMTISPRKCAARFPSKYTVNAFTAFSSFWKWVPPVGFLPSHWNIRQIERKNSTREERANVKLLRDDITPHSAGKTLARLQSYEWDIHHTVRFFPYGYRTRSSIDELGVSDVPPDAFPRGKSTAKPLTYDTVRRFRSDRRPCRWLTVRQPCTSPFRFLGYRVYPFTAVLPRRPRDGLDQFR